jgi:hypothetical protein
MLKQTIQLLLLFIILFGAKNVALAQSDILKTTINLELRNDDLITAFYKIQEQTNVPFAYVNNIIPKKKYTLHHQEIRLDQLLKELLDENDLKYKVADGQIIIQKIKYFEIFGTIRDKVTNEALTAATVYVKNSNIGITTNDYGYYSLKLREGFYQLMFSYLGLKTSQSKLSLSQRTRLDMQLESSDFELQEIIVEKPLQSEELANAPLNQETMMRLSETTPQVGGEPDLLHIVRAQAGVQSSAGGMGGLYVRGGNTGHNLVLLDGVPVYNWLHLLGINSIFNPNTVRGVQFHTSGFSARYGGRLSSVIDVQSKEGNPTDFSGMFGINQRSAHAHFSGKLGKNEKGAFWIGGRHSLVAPYVRDVIGNAFFPGDETEILPKYHDFNLKLNRQIGLNDRIYLSYYQGKDEIAGFKSYETENGEEEEENILKYGNNISSFRWNHIYGKHLFSNLTINSSRFSNRFAYLYSIEETNKEEFIYSEVASNNNENSIKLDFDWIGKKHRLKFGVAAHVYSFQPFFAIYDDESNEIPDFDSLAISLFEAEIESFDNPSIVALHSATYLEDEIHLTDKWNVRLGLRFTSFWSESSEDYHFEPRILVTNKLSDDVWLTGSVSKMVQYLHLISNTDIGLPRDLWLPTDEFYEPAVAWHYNIDVQKRMEHWNFKAAAFYKKMDNLVLLPDSLTPVDFGREVTNQLKIGNAITYGGEFSASFNYPKWNGFAAYTLSWADRYFEDVNNNEPFPFQFDSRSYFQVLANYKINDNWSAGFRGHLSTPRPELVSLTGNTLENGLQLVNLNPNLSKNEARGTYEHRTDFNINYLRKTEKLEHRLSFELYNIYNRQNPVFSYSSNNKDLTKGLFLPFMFSAYYSLKF